MASDMLTGGKGLLLFKGLHLLLCEKLLHTQNTMQKINTQCPHLHTARKGRALFSSGSEAVAH